jgi:hypothetical protein
MTAPPIAPVEWACVNKRTGKAEFVTARLFFEARAAAATRLRSSTEDVHLSVVKEGEARFAALARVREEAATMRQVVVDREAASAKPTMAAGAAARTGKGVRS